MGFDKTVGRYASFGVVTSLPGEVIDSFWYVIDEYLKGVLPLKNVLRFSVKNRKGKITLVFSQGKHRNLMAIDLNSRFDPFYPSSVLIIDKQGQETIMLPDEVNLM